MPPLKGTVILISSVLFSCKSWISVGVIAKYSLSVRLRFTPQTSLVKRFFAVYNKRVQRAFFFKTTKKRKVMKKQVDDPVGPGSPAARKKTEISAESRRPGKEEEGPKGGGPTSNAARKTTVRQNGNESLSSTPYQGCIQGKVARGHQKPCRVLLNEYCKRLFED